MATERVGGVTLRKLNNQVGLVELIGVHDLIHYIENHVYISIVHFYVVVPQIANIPVAEEINVLYIQFMQFIKVIEDHFISRQVDMQNIPLNVYSLNIIVL